MLFDSFTERSGDIYSSIVDNISDILDTCNHTSDNQTPYGFGADEITSLAYSDTPKVAADIKSAILRYETRLKNVVVIHIGTENGNMIFQISGDYKDEENKSRRLFFKKIVEIK